MLYWELHWHCDERMLAQKAKTAENTNWKICQSYTEYLRISMHMFWRLPPVSFTNKTSKEHGILILPGKHVTTNDRSQPSKLPWNVNIRPCEETIDKFTNIRCIAFQRTTSETASQLNVNTRTDTRNTREMPHYRRLRLRDNRQVESYERASKCYFICFATKPRGTLDFICLIKWFISFFCENNLPCFRASWLVVLQWLVVGTVYSLLFPRISVSISCWNLYGMRLYRSCICSCFSAVYPMWWEWQGMNTKMKQRANNSQAGNNESEWNNQISPRFSHSYENAIINLCSK